MFPRLKGARQFAAGALSLVAAAGMLAATSAQTQPQSSQSQSQSQPQSPSEAQGFKFRSGVELINVTATVTDTSGRFVGGLRQEDFDVYEDNQPQTVTHFSADRVPVSLGILLDTSQSMHGEKFEAARGALDQFLEDLSSPDDEFFLMQFSSTPHLVQSWTNDRQRISRLLAGVMPRGGTAMYDAIADSLPLSQQARNRKKAIVIISDGNDMTSETPVSDIHKIIRESESLIYAVGIDCSGVPTFRRQFRPMQLDQVPRPFPFPMPGRRPGWPQPLPPQPPPNRGDFRRCSDPVDVMALRDLTDDTGGRTEIVRDARDLNPATASIADELSKQYYLGYPSQGKKDGRWHTIRVEVHNKSYRVRARRGYIAS